jgi:putative membrane protein insertion efficiency factor
MMRATYHILKISLSWVILGIINIYRYAFSPFLGVNCRHLPTCSQYAKDAVIEHGPLHGSHYALKRILRCHPMAEPAVDPVPPNVKPSMHYCKAKADNGEG